VSGGDDYEILCTVPDERCASFLEETHSAGVTVTPIGRVVAESGAPRFLDAQGREITLRQRSYSHF
jgi:thiamine-monophosphate kinase